MFARRFAFAIAFVLTAVLMGIRPAAAETKTPFVMSTTFEKVPGYPQAGEVSMPGTNYHEKGWIDLFHMTTTSEKFTGLSLFIGNSHYRLGPPGPNWGADEIRWWVDVTPEDGVWEWEGTCQGLARDGAWHNQCIGHGLGSYQGLTVKMVHIYDPMTGTESITGEILDPHGN